METAVRVVRLVQLGMLVCVAVCVALGEILGHAMASNNALFHTLSLAAISTLGVAFVVRRTLVLPAELLLGEKPDDLLAQARWRTSYTFLYGLCEVPVLFGLILRIKGFTLGHVWGFYLGGLVLLVLFSPRPRRKQSR